MDGYMRLVALITLILLILASLIQAEVSYYDGVFDSCMMTLFHLNGEFDQKEYNAALGYCRELQSSAKQADGYRKNIDVAPSDTKEL